MAAVCLQSARCREPSAASAYDGPMTRAKRPGAISSTEDPWVALRTRLEWSIGLTAGREVDGALALIEEEGPLIVLGPPGLDQVAIARAIHHESDRVLRPFVVLGRRVRAAELEAAQGGTVVVDLATVQVTPTLVRALLGWGRTEQTLAIRPVFVARTRVVVSRVLGVIADGPVIQLRGLSERGRDVPVMLDRLLAQSGSGPRVAALPAKDIAGLTRARWARNLETLRESAVRLAAFLELGLSGAGRRLGISRQSMDLHLRRMFDHGAMAARHRKRTVSIGGRPRRQRRRG